MARMLRILMVTRSLPFHSLGGMETITWDLARSFVELGAKITILTTACPRLDPDCEKEGVRIRCLNTPPGRYSRSWWRESRHVYISEFADQVDIVLSVGAGARGIVAGRRSKHPAFIMQVHGTAWTEFISKVRQRTLWAWMKSIRNLVAMIEDRAYRLFDGFIAIGQVVERDLTTYPSKYLIGNLPVILIENGVSKERFAFNPALRKGYRDKLNLLENAKIIFSASRLHPQKGIFEGLNGFAIAARLDNSLHYVIAGSGPDEDRLRMAANASGVADRIHFIGNISRDELYGWFSMADIFMFTTKRVEGLPMNILEALAAGLPLIASRDVLGSNFPGISVDPDDFQSIADAIRRSSVNERRESQLTQNYELNNAAKKYLDVFHSYVSIGNV